MRMGRPPPKDGDASRDGAKTPPHSPKKTENTDIHDDTLPHTASHDITQPIYYIMCTFAVNPSGDNKNDCRHPADRPMVPATENLSWTKCLIY